jgi:hypothetical protein
MFWQLPLPTEIAPLFELEAESLAVASATHSLTLAPGTENFPRAQAAFHSRKLHKEYPLSKQSKFAS